MKHSQPDYRFISRRGALLSFALLLLSLSALIPKTAWASSSCHVNGNLTVTISATGVAFGGYNVMSAAATSGTGTITVSATCTHATVPFTVSYSIALSTGGSGSFTLRDMTAGSSKLQYNMYTSAALATLWGDGTAGTQQVSDTLFGTCNKSGNNCSGSQNDVVYGIIPAMQNVAAGNYADTITVTVSF